MFSADEKGFHYHGKLCSCPDDCIIHAYGADLSYATLSTLSVDMLLTGDSRLLENKYHRALEIQHRVDVQKLEKTLKLLLNVTTALRYFKVGALSGHEK